MKKLVYMISIFVFVLTFSSQAVEVDFSSFDKNGKVNIAHSGNELIVDWADKTGKGYQAVFSLNGNDALIKSLKAGSAGSLKEIASEVNPRYRVIHGRREKEIWPYKFFDRIDKNMPAPKPHLSVLNLKDVKISSESLNRLRVDFSTLNIGPYSGKMSCTFYSGSPFIRFQATMKVSDPWVAYIYDSLIYADFKSSDYKDAKTDKMVSSSSESFTNKPGTQGLKVRYRTIMGKVKDKAGLLALFPPPHAAFYPTDFSNNLGFVQAGNGYIGTRMVPEGDNRFRPWINAPNGSLQRMDSFLLISDLDSEKTLEKVLKYTNGDFLKPLPGRFTMTEHFHPEITMSQKSDSATPFKKTMQKIGLQIAQLKEFHGYSAGKYTFKNTERRLKNLNAMFGLCKKHSDSTFVFIPGEEYSKWFGGHWSYIFPKPIYFTGWDHGINKEFLIKDYKLGNESVDKVYQIRNSEQFLKMLELEGGLAWTAHPRIKGAQKMPDSYLKEKFYKSSTFQIGDWKNMPLNLSHDRLGIRGLQLMNETAQWGYDKKMLGAADTFKLYPDHEIYAHMAVNYMKLSKLPNANEWSELVDCIRKGDFFTTTGELLIHSWSADKEGVSAEVEWYFPPEFAEITWGNESGVYHKKINLHTKTENGKETLRINADLSSANWVRFEAWDIARNGAFTQLFWFSQPKNPEFATTSVKSFSLINTDSDTAVPGYDPIGEGAILDLSKLPKNLTIRCNTSPLIVDEVLINFGKENIIKKYFPYSLGKDCKMDYMPVGFKKGRVRISAACKLGEIAGQKLTLSFEIIDSNN